MDPSPIVLFVYNRPWHTRQTIEALLKNELASESELFIFADGPKSKASDECKSKVAEVKQYIQTITGFKKITIKESTENKGLAESVIYGVTQVIKQFGKVIVVEDDIVTHRFFLRFMNEALNVYANRKDIFSISATMEYFDIPHSYKNDVFLTYRMGSWGWATWKDQWESISWDIRKFKIINKPTKKRINKLCRGGNDLWPMLQEQFKGNIDSWAIRVQYNMTTQNKYSIRPTKSFATNIGMDGSGINCIESTVPLLPIYNMNNYHITLPPKLKKNKKITQSINPPKKLFDEIKYQINKIHDHKVFRRFWMRKHSKKEQPLSKTILVIRIDAIGDCIIWLDQAKEYRKTFPNHRIVLLHNKVWTDIAKRLPWFDECIPFDRSKINDKDYYLHLISELNKYTYEILFSPVFSRDFFSVDWIVHNINAREKIGYEGDYQNNHFLVNQNIYILKKYDKINFKKKADKWFTFLVPNDKNAIMELQRNAHFLRCTINPDFQSALPILPFEVPITSLIPIEKYAILFLGASFIQKTWPLNNFIKITQHIPYHTIVLCGDEKDIPIANDYLLQYKGDKTIINLTGKTSLLELISLISNASFIITNDTSASHIAIATRTKSICILSGVHYGRFHPYQADIIKKEDKKYLPKVVTSQTKDCFNCNLICKHPLQNNRWKCIDEIRVVDVESLMEEYFIDNNDLSANAMIDTY